MTLRRHKRWFLFGTPVALLAVVAFVGGTAFAGGGDPRRPPAATEQAEATGSMSGGGVALTRVRTEDSVHSTQNPFFYSTLPGSRGTVSFSVGSGSWLIIAQFDAETDCRGSSGYCAMRTLINGVEACPRTSNDVAASRAHYAIDSDPSGAGNDESEGHSFTRSRVVQGPGTVTVNVQWAAIRDASINTIFTIDDTHLLVQAVSAGSGSCAG
jgi:hypothetical protein